MLRLKSLGLVQIQFSAELAAQVSAHKTTTTATTATTAATTTTTTTTATR